MRRLKGSKAEWGVAARFVKSPVLWGGREQGEAGAGRVGWELADGRADHKARDGEGENDPAFQLDCGRSSMSLDGRPKGRVGLGSRSGI